MMLIDEKWKNIAEGNTAFIIGGGPSVKNMDENKLKDIIKNNFTITINYNIQYYDNISMYLTSDNRIAREFFEGQDFVLEKLEYGQFKSADSPDSPIINTVGVKSFKRHPDLSEYIRKNEDTIKVLIAQTLNDLNEIVDGGQISLLKAARYATQYKNTFLMGEYKEDVPYSIFGVTGPLLSKDWKEGYEIYGNIEKSNRPVDIGDKTINMLEARAGGNIISQVLQLLYHMNFDKVITIGWGDGGDSKGSTNNFVWSKDETDSIPVHNEMWGDRLKILSGGEILKEYGEFKDASIEELENNKEQKDILIHRIKNL